MPQARFYNATGEALPAASAPESVAYTVYEIHIRPGMRYQPHPALAVDAQGEGRYLHLTPDDIASRNTLADFPERGTREVTAADFVYQIKHHAHPKQHSPIVGLMSEYIVGLKDYQVTKQKTTKTTTRRNEPNNDLDQY